MQEESTSLPKQFVVFDTEFTAWEGSQERGWSGPNEHREVIQIGAVKVDDLHEIDSFMRYVRPTVNSMLSDYIQTLTGVTQKDVDEKGSLYAEVQHAFYTWCEGLPMFSMNGGDGRVLEENSRLHDIDFPFGEEAHHSVSALFRVHDIDTSSYVSSTLPAVFGLTPPRNAHDALNDARSILLALQGLYTSERV